MIGGSVGRAGRDSTVKGEEVREGGIRNPTVQPVRILREERAPVLAVFLVHDRVFGTGPGSGCHLGCRFKLGGKGFSFDGFCREFVGIMGITSTKRLALTPFSGKCRIGLDSAAGLVHYPQSC